MNTSPIPSTSKDCPDVEQQLLPPMPTEDEKKSPLALLAQTCNQIGMEGVSGTKLQRISGSKQKPKYSRLRDRFSPGVITVAGDVSTTSSSDSSPTSPFKDTPRRININIFKDDGAGTSYHSAAPPQRSILTPKYPTTPPTRINKKSVTLKVPRLISPSSSSEKFGYKQEISNAAKPESPNYGIPASHYDTTSSTLTGVNSIQGPMKTLAPGAMINPYPIYNFQKPHVTSTTTSGEQLVQLYRDPFCIGCQLGTHPPHPVPVGGGDTCPPNCNNCVKHNAVLAAAVSNMNNQFAVSTILARAMPFICNWVVAEGQCGRRFGSSDELLQHLTTHMNVSSTSSTMTATHPAPQAPAMLPLLSPSHALLPQVQTQQRAYPTPPLSPMSSRFHPYTKPKTNTTQAPALAIPVTPYIPFAPYLYLPTASQIHQ